MTRLFDPPDPNPGKVFEAALAQGILLWEEGLEEKHRLSWTHARHWDRSTEPRAEIQVVAFAAVRAALSLYAEPDWSPPEGRESAHEYAGDFLRKLLYSRSGFSRAVLDLADNLAKEYSSSIDLQFSVRGGEWYVMGELRQARTNLARLKEQPILARFKERFKELYPETAELLRSLPPERIYEMLEGALAMFKAVTLARLDDKRAACAS